MTDRDVHVQRTTLALEDRLLERLREKARREHRQLQDCVNEVLSRGLEALERPPEDARPLPSFSMGAPRVNLADRDALYDLMDDD